MYQSKGILEILALKIFYKRVTTFLKKLISMSNWKLTNFNNTDSLKLKIQFCHENYSILLRMAQAECVS